jgi:hypothetical protein
VSPGRREEGGIPHARRTLAELPGRAPIEEQWQGADEAKVEKLRRNNLERRARACGLRLRHSDRGYALIDPTHEGSEGRNNMTLDEIESRLERK